MDKRRNMLAMKIQSPVGTKGSSLTRIDEYVMYLLNANMC